MRRRREGNYNIYWTMLLNVKYICIIIMICFLCDLNTLKKCLRFRNSVLGYLCVGYRKLRIMKMKH